MANTTILELNSISKCFSIERGLLKQKTQKICALDKISFRLDEFSTLGIVGESGSGKTTLAKIILGLIPASGGSVRFDQDKISNFRKDAQIIFQNPFNSLNPKMRVRSILTEPLLVHSVVGRSEMRGRAIELLRMVGLDESALERYPKEFSGGQRQRICIARALASEPKLLILDEPLSSLDLTIQARMLDLLSELKKRLKLTYIFISHNLALIKQVADSVLVMHNGRIVEQGSIEDIFSEPKSEYTRTLLEAARGVAPRPC